MRIPNVCLLGILSGLILIAPYRSLVSKKEAAIYFVLYFFITVFCTTSFILLLYGSINGYISTFENMPIGAHSNGYLCYIWFSSFFFQIRYFCIILTIYACIYFIDRKVLNKIVQFIFYFILGVILFVSLIPPKRLTLGNVIDVSISLGFLGFCILSYKAYKHQKKGVLFIAISLFLLCLIPTAGSNWGFIKFLVWPMIPIIYTYLSYDISRALRIFAIIYGVSLTTFSVYAYRRPTFGDANLNELTYKLNMGVLEGMHTTPERGSHIQQVYTQTSFFISKGYHPIILKAGNDYLWEYLFLKPNLLKRHSFDDWYAFNDKEYVKNIDKKAKKDSRSLLMYMQWKDENEPTEMIKMLNSEYFCIIDGGGYSFYVFPYVEDNKLLTPSTTKSCINEVALVGGDTNPMPSAIAP